MGTWLKQSTNVDVALGPFVDSTDGFTPETGLSLTQAECRIKKGGNAWAQKNHSTTATHEEEGWYEVPLDTTDTNTLGPLMLAVYVTGALPCWREFEVVPANVWDSFFGADALDVSVIQFGGTALTQTGGRPEVNTTHAAGTAWASGSLTSGVFAAGAINATAIAADAIGASELAADAVTEIATAVAAPSAATIADAVWDEDATAHQTTGTFGQAIGDPVADTNTIYKAVVTDAAAATVGLDVVAVQADTDNIQTRIPAALVSGRIDASVGAMAAGTVTAAAIATDAIDDDAIATGAIASTAFAAGAINAAAIAADAIGASELAADAVTEIQSGLATAASIAALNNISTAQVNAEVLDVLNTDTFAEPGQGNPAASATLVQKIGYLYKAWRNRTTQTASEYALYADDATTKDQEAVVSDNGTTFERGEVSTGA